MNRFTQLSLFNFILFSICFGFEAMATHNRAGEITYIQIGPLTIEATITTYTKASSTAADRDSLEICWYNGGPCQWVQRANGNGELLPNDTKYNYYVATFTYPGPGHYTISMNDPNRNGDTL